MEAAAVNAPMAPVRTRPSIWVQAPELARRSIMRTVRPPASIIPATTFPLILLANYFLGVVSENQFIYFQF